MPVPPIRVRACNAAPLQMGGRYVLYWMIANRRPRYNFALERAVEACVELQRPLVVFEGLRVDYPWASDRVHGFILQGMADQRVAFERRGVLYHAYLEPMPGQGKGLLEALARDACLVVTDEFPCFFLPHMVEAAARRLPVRLEQVDSIGIVPLRAPPGAFPTAHAFRRWLQKNGKVHLGAFPVPDPLDQVELPAAPTLPLGLVNRWPSLGERDLADASLPRLLEALPIDSAIGPGLLRGGVRTACEALSTFLDEQVDGYAQRRNEPDADATSNLSPWLHFGHISAHEVFSQVMGREQWRPEHLSARAAGQREGWWGVGRDAEVFLDQLVTWREVGFQAAAHLPAFDAYESLPRWAHDTLARHASDPRPYRYTASELTEGRTHDVLWNAAQNQLRCEGRMHNQVRMLWGKKVIEWSADPREAFALLVHLNNKYALDGRDPNSYSGIGWCFGRFDRPWPERPIFGSVRSMSSHRMAQKHAVREYTRKYS